MNVTEEKAALRRDMQARRPGFASPGAGLRLAEAVLAIPSLPPGPVSAYLPIADEIDVLPTLAALARAGRQLALPCVAARDRPLVFRAWKPGDPVVPGSFGTREPAPGAPLLRPAVLLVPLLAVDRRGWRLGWGAGYYDRTLAELRGSGGAVAIGICYAGQVVEHVPHHAMDQPMDWIATEEGARPAARA